jgi:peptidoglycan/LPS O-acetylase OafA/YrhL
MRSAQSNTTTSVVRTDIQGLRALAVTLVLVYHLSPKTLSGGFIGVDVFFVISGFLITLHLLGHVPSGPRDLAKFWSRRVRRLLPASLLVLATTLVASRLFAPETQWANTAKQSRAAALYIVNWVLSSNAVDYLASTNAASPVQHFWSLSVEEQFYFIWPILILLLGLLARRLRRENTLHLVLAGLVMVVAASLAYSIHETASNPAAAYFVTPTRVWELGIGGVLATLHLMTPGNLRELFAIPLSWLGFAAIAYAAVTYTGSTPFPGWQAAVPVLGTAAVIGAHSMHGSGSPGNILSLRPIQWLGDISYSVYLWHYPLVVIVPQATGHHLTWTERGSIVLATLALAALTKTYVEDRFRTATWGNPLPKPFAIAGLAMAVVIAGAGLQLHEVTQRDAESQAEAARKLGGADPCFGAPALLRASCPKVSYDDLLPIPSLAATDKSDAYDIQANGRDCWSYTPRFVVKTCTFGVRTASQNVVVIGNSHAGQWLPAIQRLAKKDTFKVTTLLASQCALSEVRQQFDTDAWSTACLGWVKKVVRRVINLKPDLVVMTNRISVPVDGQSLEASIPLYGEGYRKVLEAWKAAGIHVLVLHDTPAPGPDDIVPDCIATEKSNYAKCDGKRSDWVKPEPAQSAVASLGDPDIRFADLNDHICEPVVCHAVNGGVITYFDGSHLTATYAATLAPFLGVPLLAMLRRTPAG